MRPADGSIKERLLGPLQFQIESTLVPKDCFKSPIFSKPPKVSLTACLFITRQLLLAFYCFILKNNVAKCYFTDNKIFYNFIRIKLIFISITEHSHFIFFPFKTTLK